MKESFTFGRRLPGSPEELRPTVEAALKAEGFGVVTEIDVSEVMRTKLGVEQPPYLILGACNAGLAHQALDIDPAVGTLLPCNVVLRAEGDLTVIEAIDPVSAMAISGSSRLRAVAMQAREHLVRAISALRPPGPGATSRPTSVRRAHHVVV